MAITAGSVSVNDVGIATGSGLALAIYNEQLVADTETPNPPPKSGAVSTKKSLARFSNHAAAAIAAQVNAGMLVETQLAAEPVTENLTYSNTIGAHLTQEQWKRVDTSLLKQIDYTYSGSNINTEIRKIFALDGTTVIAQVTIVYGYAVSTVVSKTITRNV